MSTDIVVLPPGAIGVDYSFGRPDIAKLRAAGVRFACRYISHDARKDLSAAERDELHAAGIAIILNWELWQTRPYSEIDDAAAGRLDGLEFVARARAIGLPAGEALYVSVDTDLTTQYAEVEAYLRAFEASVTAGGYKAAVYGELDLIEFCVQRNMCLGGFWQPFAWSPRGVGLQGVRQHPRANFFQYLGLVKLSGVVGIGSVDENVTLLPTRAWLAGATAPTIPAPTTEETTVQRLIAYDDAPGDIYIASDWDPTRRTCLVVIPATADAIGAFQPLTGPYPSPGAGNPWGVEIVEAAARAHHVLLPLTPGGGFYSETASGAGARGPAGPAGPTGPKGDKGDPGKDGPTVAAVADELGRRITNG